MHVVEVYRAYKFYTKTSRYISDKTVFKTLKISFSNWQKYYPNNIISFVIYSSSSLCVRVERWISRLAPGRFFSTISSRNKLLLTVWKCHVSNQTLKIRLTHACLSVKLIIHWIIGAFGAFKKIFFIKNSFFPKISKSHGIILMITFIICTCKFIIGIY